MGLLPNAVFGINPYISVNFSLNFFANVSTLPQKLCEKIL